MKFQIFSDLHMEYDDHEKSCTDSFLKKLLDPQSDYYVFAGDIGIGYMETFDRLLKIVDNPSKLIYIGGNHEFYGLTLEKIEWDGDHVRTFHFLKDGVLVIANTLWSYIPDQFVNAVKGTWDFQQMKGLTPSMWNYWHNSCLLDIKKLLNKYEGQFEKSVIITHYAPSFKSVLPEYVGASNNCIFANNLNDMIEEYSPNLWIHGHMHSPLDYVLHKTRVVCNPRGYPHVSGDMNANYKGIMVEI
jgi:Icc-related predicted phosphoesterase